MTATITRSKASDQAWSRSEVFIPAEAARTKTTCVWNMHSMTLPNKYNRKQATTDRKHIIIHTNHNTFTDNQQHGQAWPASSDIQFLLCMSMVVVGVAQKGVAVRVDKQANKQVVVRRLDPNKGLERTEFVTQL